MRILNVTAQKPDSTGSGVYLAEMVRCEVAAGHSAAVICGIAPDDPLPFPAGVSAYPVHFETDEGGAVSRMRYVGRNALSGNALSRHGPSDGFLLSRCFCEENRAGYRGILP